MLDFERRRLEAGLAQGELQAAERAAFIGRLEDLDLAIAATPARNCEDLRIKISRLAALIHPLAEPIAEDCLEHVMLAAILRDTETLAAAASD
ncbi:MAG: hypothetical protein WD076_10230 [Parvularculaceae bacterium]